MKRLAQATLCMSVALGLLAGCGGGPSPEEARLLREHAAMLAADSTEQALHQAREQTLRALFRMYQSGNTEEAGSYLAEDYIEHTPPPGMEVKGIQGYQDLVVMMGQGWSENHFTIHAMAHRGDTLFAHYTWTGRNTGDLMPGVPATGKEVSASGMEVLLFDGTMATDHWGYFEEMKTMAQLGMLPDTAAPKEKKE